MAEEQQKLEATEGTMDEAKLVGGSQQRQKPVFEKMTPATIKDVKWFKREPVKALDKNGKETEFIPSYLQVYFTVDGFSEEVVENYGFRIYKTNNPDVPFNAYYGTDKSIAGRLRSLTESTFDMDTAADLPTFMNTLKGKSVMLKSEETSFGGQKYFPKQVIQQFRV